MNKLLLRIELVIDRTDSESTRDLFDLNIDLDQLTEFARAVIDGESLSIGRWTGPLAPFSRGEYEYLRSVLLKQNIIRPIAKTSQHGYCMTRTGYLFFKSIITRDYESEEIEDTSYFDTMGIVYVVTYDDVHVKIGITNSLFQRLQSLQTACPQKIRLLGAFEIEDYTTVEKEIHNQLSKYNTQGEWFELPQDEVQRVLDFLANRRPKTKQLRLI